MKQHGLALKQKTGAAQGQAGNKGLASAKGRANSKEWANAYGSIDHAAEPLTLLASLSACGLRASIGCQDPACSLAREPDSCRINRADLVVDMLALALAVERGEVAIVGMAGSSVAAGVAWKLADMAHRRGAGCACPGTITRRLRDRQVDLKCAGQSTITFATDDGLLPPVVLADYGTTAPSSSVKAICDKLKLEASFTVTVGSSRGEYDLAAIIYNVNDSHFVSQYDFMGRAYYHDAMHGRPVLVGSRIDVAYGFRVHASAKCAVAMAVYVLRSDGPPAYRPGDA